MLRKRRLCQLCVCGILFLVMLFYLTEGGCYKELRPSVCEQVLRGKDIVWLTGNIYKKEERVLYLENLNICTEHHTVAADERLPVYLADIAAESMPEIGKTVLVKGSVIPFQTAPNPGNFNQKFYYQKQNMHVMLREAVIEKTGGKADTFREGLWKLRQHLCGKIRSAMGNKYGGMLALILLNDDSYVEDEPKELFQKSGIGHLMAISGLHMTFMGEGLLKLLKKAGCQTKAAVIISCLGLTFYLFLIEPGVSALRAYLMFLLRMGASLLGREYDGLTAMAAAALVTLMYNPLQLFDAGFLLSYGAVIGIYGISKEVSVLTGDYLSVPVSLQIILLPIMLYSYYEICIYSLLWNLIAIPLAAPLMGCAVLGVLTEIGLFYRTAGLILQFYETGSRILLELPGARAVTGKPEILQIVFYYIVIFLMLFCVRCRRKGTRILYLLISICILTVPQKVNQELEITMVNVGQGDCFVIRLPTGENLLIDGGSSSVNSVGRYRIEPYLKSEGIGELDYVFLSHGDEDHINGVKELIVRQRLGVKIKGIVLPPRKFWDEQLTELAALSGKEAIPVYEMKQGQSLAVSKMRITCLWPDSHGNTEGNEASMVLSVSYGGFDMLFTGDLEKESEKAMVSYMKECQKNGRLPEKYEILKAGHHGSKNATGEELLEVSRPDAAWISAGENNRYGHPHEEVLLRLANRGINRYNTKDGSAVKLCTDGEKYYILEP